MDPAILICLAITTSIYAVLLDRYGARWRDWTELKVIVGVLLVLGATAWRYAINPWWTGADYQLAIWVDFGVGGVPIVLWYAWRQRKDSKTALKKATRNQLKLQQQTDASLGEVGEDGE